MDGYLTIVQHEEYAKRMDDEHKRQNKRIDRLEENQKQINDLTLAVKELAISVKSMVDKTKDHDERIEVLESRDGEKWRNVTMDLIKIIMGIVVGYVAVQIGL